MTVVGHGDTLAPTALAQAAMLLQRLGADAVYTDEDRIDVFDRHDRVLRKPFWSPDLPLSEHYPGGLCLVRRATIEPADAPAERQRELAAEHELVRRLRQHKARIVHLPICLYHRRHLPRPAGVHAGGEPAAGGKLAAPPTADGSIRISAIVTVAPEAERSQIGDQLAAIQAPCLHELIVTGEIDGRADRQARSSPAAIANAAAARASGNFLMFIDGRASLAPSTEPGWLDQLVALAARDRVGAVGGEVRDSDGRWLQGGLRPGLGALAGPWSDASSRPLLADQICNPLALGGTVLLIRRSVFESLEGFDAERLPTLFAVDLSLRAARAAWRNVFCPALRVLVPGAEPAADRELAQMIRAWTPELSLIAAYDRASTEPLEEPGPEAEVWPKPILAPGERPGRISRPLAPSL